MENIAVTQMPGCLAALFGSKETTTYFNMLVFSKEGNALTQGNLPSDSNERQNEKQSVSRKNDYKSIIRETTFNDSLGLDAKTIRLLKIGEKVKVNNVLMNFNKTWAYFETQSSKEEGWCLFDALSE